MRFLLTIGIPDLRGVRAAELPLLRGDGRVTGRGYYTAKEPGTSFF